MENTSVNGEKMTAKRPSEHICIGLLAHVDAGKTTLTEAILYNTGQIRRMGRVDHQDCCFDTHEIERQRGITVFSEQSPFVWKDRSFTLIDTPGHVDFSAEMERTLRILDYAVLVVDGTNGIQGHTETIWGLLKEYRIPAFLFVNKMDYAKEESAEILRKLRERLDEGCLDFTEEFSERQAGASAETEAGLSEELLEEAAMLDENWMDAFAAEDRTAEWWEREIREGIRSRKIFPCIFGSSLQNENVDRLLSLMARFCISGEWESEFSAEVYKILHDEQGNRLTFLKVTGGELMVRMPVPYSGLEEKISQIRIYSGAKFEAVQSIEAGGICAVTGLTRTYPGMLLGRDAKESGRAPILHPMLYVAVILEDGTDTHTAVRNFRILEEEMPELEVKLAGQTGEIQIHVMGKIQLEILEQVLQERFRMKVSFGPCRILYKETVRTEVTGYGHYEPLRHYAEAHVKLAPGKRGSGVRVENTCSLEMLDKNYQQLILTHIREKEHLGILTGSPLTDVVYTLTAGRAHLKHTEGGDFRQAVYRAIRQGLEKADNILLEPYYDFRLRVPQDMAGRAMSDIQRMHGTFGAPDIQKGDAVLCGTGPVSEFMDYAEEVRAYTGGRGMISFRDGGYRECHNTQEVIERIGYEKERDLDNPSSSIFCSHGAGYEVKWDEVDAARHIIE